MLKRLLQFAILASLSGACSQNFPLGPKAGDLPADATYGYVAEVIDSNTLFAPNSSSSSGAATQLPTFGGPVQYSWGNDNVQVNGVATYASYPTLMPTTHSASTALVTDNGFNLPPRNIGFGIGGPGDYFARYRGRKGPDSSIDYNSFSMFFKGITTPFDLESQGYRGFIFFARGTGNWEVGLSAGISNGGALADYPYATFNFYSKVFGPELAGSTQWKQFTVFFDAMTQLYGQAVDIKRVLPKAYGLQFDQIAPQTIDFTLDIDYVQMF